MEIVTLNQFEHRIVKFIAKERFTLARTTGKAHEIYGIAELENEINSFGAEFAFCKANNCYPDLTPGQLLPFDAVIDGTSFDIKQTHRETGRLLVRRDVGKKIDPPEFYVLIIGRSPSYKIAGYIPGTEVLQECNVDFKLPHPAYAIDQSRLLETWRPEKELAM